MKLSPDDILTYLCATPFISPLTTTFRAYVRVTLFDKKKKKQRKRTRFFFFLLSRACIPYHRRYYVHTIYRCLINVGRGIKMWEGVRGEQNVGI